MSADCTVSAADWAATSAAGAAVIVAAVAAWITWRQYAVSRDQMRLALFERRLEVYEEVYSFLADIQRDAHVNNRMMADFYDPFHKSIFLFGKDVREYLVEIRNHALAKQSSDTIAEASTDNEERSKNVNTAFMHFKWLVNAIDELPDKFGSYLNFHDEYNW